MGALITPEYNLVGAAARRSAPTCSCDARRKVPRLDRLLLEAIDRWKAPRAP
jgi:hypothetical protein